MKKQLLLIIILVVVLGTFFILIFYAGMHSQKSPPFMIWINTGFKPNATEIIRNWELPKQHYPEPLLGWYNIESAETQLAIAKQLRDYGIEVAALQMPRNETTRPNIKLFIQALRQYGIKFTLLIENFLGIFKPEEILEVYQQVKEYYYDEPNFFQYDGRPLLLMYHYGYLPNSADFTVRSMYGMVGGKNSSEMVYTFDNINYYETYNYIDVFPQRISHDFPSGRTEMIALEVKADNFCLKNAYPKVFNFTRVYAFNKTSTELAIKRAMDYADIVWIASYNDYGEGNHIEPTKESDLYIRTIAETKKTLTANPSKYFSQISAANILSLVFLCERLSKKIAA